MEGSTKKLIIGTVLLLVTVLVVLELTTGLFGLLKKKAADTSKAEQDRVNACKLISDIANDIDPSKVGGMEAQFIRGIGLTKAQMQQTFCTAFQDAANPKTFPQDLPKRSQLYCDMTKEALDDADALIKQMTDACAPDDKICKEIIAYATKLQEASRLLAPHVPKEPEACEPDSETPVGKDIFSPSSQS